MRNRAETEKLAALAGAAFIILMILQWAFGVREPDANGVARWLIGGGKLVTMFVLLVVGLRWLQFKFQEHKNG